MKKVQILIDSSHKKWVLGGLFTEVSHYDPEFFLKPQIISNVKSFRFTITFFRVLKLVCQRRLLLFSSITPLENFLKISKFNTNKKILWFTHMYGEMSEKTIFILDKADLIFVHSSQDREFLISKGISCPIIPLIGAINPKLFLNPNYDGKKVAFIGSATKRKNVDVFLQFVSENPKLQFKVIGRNWKRHDIWETLTKYKNLEYFEINRQINAEDLKDCSHHLILSSKEGGPISLIESVASGLIPVMTKTGIALDFLYECDYLNQILDFPINFSEVRRKLEKVYSIDHRSLAAKKALEYSISRFSFKLKVEIMNNLHGKNNGLNQS